MSVDFYITKNVVVSLTVVYKEDTVCTVGPKRYCEETVEYLMTFVGLQK